MSCLCCILSNLFLAFFVHLVVQSNYSSSFVLVVQLRHLISSLNCRLSDDGSYLAYFCSQTMAHLLSWLYKTTTSLLYIVQSDYSSSLALVVLCQVMWWWHLMPLLYSVHRQDYGSSFVLVVQTKFISCLR